MRFLRDIVLQLAPIYAPINPSLWKIANEELKEAERLSKIGKALEKAMNDESFSISKYEFGSGSVLKEIKRFTIEQLVEWAESEGE